jgi:hypothetical protein
MVSIDTPSCHIGSTCEINTYEAICFPSGKATRQVTGPDSIGVLSVRSRFGAVEEEVFRTSHMSMVPFRRPAKTWVPSPDQHAYRSVLWRLLEPLRL